MELPPVEEYTKLVTALYDEFEAEVLLTPCKAPTNLYSAIKGLYRNTSESPLPEFPLVWYNILMGPQIRPALLKSSR